MSRFRSIVMVLGAASISTSVFANEPTGSQKKAEGIHWLDDLGKAMAVSAVDGRPVIAYFTFGGCVWCKRLEQDTLSDADVIALSRKFVWVKINRDDTPEIPQRLSVSAYPTLITLGDRQEKIYRFQSYQQPAEFIANLNEALRRYRLYREGKEWDTPETRPSTICERGAIETIRAPSEERPAGITFLRDDMWVLQGHELYRFDTKSGDFKKARTFAEGRLIVDLCSDGNLLYAVDYGWSAGEPIGVVDPKTGWSVREIETAANKDKKVHSTRGIAYHAGKLYVLSGMSGVIHEVDPRSGAVTREITSAEKWLSGLDFDGENFVSGTRTHLVFLDPQVAGVVKKVPVNYPLRSVAVHKGAFYLLEQPIFGYDKGHKRIRVWPKVTMVYRLTLGSAD